MRLLHIVHQYLPHHVGGTELYTQTLARYQALQEGHDVAIFYPSPQPLADAQAAVEGSVSLREEEGGVRVYAVGLNQRSRAHVFLDTVRQPRALEALQEALDRETPDLVHVQHLMGLPVAVVDEVRRRHIALVITLHDYWFPCANGQLLTNYDGTICAGPNYWINCGRCALARAGLGDRPLLAPAVAPLMAYRGRLTRHALAQADRVIAPTRFVRDTYERVGMPMDRAVVVPHGIQVPAAVLQRAQEPRPPREPNRPLHLVYVGSVAPQKGLHVLVDAVNDLPADAVRLSVYGDLGTFPDYAAQLRAAAGHPGISFCGRIEREAFWRLLLEEADVAVLPTLWYEASPLTIQEMFAARVPLVASRIGAIPEKIRGGIDGLLFPPGDAAALRDTLQRLLDDPSLLPWLRANIRPTRLMEEHVREVGEVYDGLKIG